MNVGYEKVDDESIRAALLSQPALFVNHGMVSIDGDAVRITMFEKNKNTLVPRVAVGMTLTDAESLWRILDVCLRDNREKIRANASANMEAMNQGKVQ